MKAPRGLGRVPRDFYNSDAGRAILQRVLRGELSVQTAVSEIRTQAGRSPSEKAVAMAVVRERRRVAQQPKYPEEDLLASFLGDITEDVMKTRLRQLEERIAQLQADKTTLERWIGNRDEMVQSLKERLGERARE